MRNVATGISAEEQQIARQYLALGLPGLELFDGSARYPDARLVVGVLHPVSYTHLDVYKRQACY